MKVRDAQMLRKAGNWWALLVKSKYIFGVLLVEGVKSE